MNLDRSGQLELFYLFYLKDVGNKKISIYQSLFMLFVGNGEE